jgi:hypothetical protein
MTLYNVRYRCRNASLGYGILSLPKRPIKWVTLEMGKAQSRGKVLSKTEPCLAFQVSLHPEVTCISPVSAIPTAFVQSGPFRLCRIWVSPCQENHDI